MKNSPRDELIEGAVAVPGLRLDDLFVEAERLPPDMQRDLSRVVNGYRRMKAVNRYAPELWRGPPSVTVKNGPRPPVCRGRSRRSGCLAAICGENEGMACGW